MMSVKARHRQSRRLRHQHYESSGISVVIT
jgi:hypothetical protein